MKSKYIKVIAFCSLLAVANSSNAQLAPLAIGTINAGDSVVIYYDATINTGAGSQVSNQGTISGSNFITFSTDDPATGPLGDPTITPLNVFPLPVSFYELKANAAAGGIEVAWQVTAEDNMQKYEVERSTNGREFAKIGEVVSQNSTQVIRYRFVDANPNNGLNYYRLRLIDRTSAKYSVIVRVDLTGKNAGIVIYPNPVQQQQVTLQLQDVPKGSYQLLLVSSVGQTVYRTQFTHDGGSVSRTVILPRNIRSGIYGAKVQGESIQTTQLLIIQ